MTTSSGYRILVVDDEEPIRKGLARVMAGLGHEVEVAESAEEALEKATSLHRPTWSSPTSSFPAAAVST